MKTQPATGETYPKSDLFNKAGGLLYLVYDDYRDNGTATEEQLLMISHEIPCAGEDFRTALRNSPGPLTLHDAKKIAAKCNEKHKQLNALNNVNK
ncbi:hypothetical protein [Klebsiella variicola]|uniref:hypothetical protein n=1 Tax=Klebsiella variicola TaxID=244366 RepID=UPI001D194305|nr:hypothetical protein [Klebsiella variicola]MBR7398123.1 hypothetical protein [Klebsiella variicola]